MKLTLAILLAICGLLAFTTSAPVGEETKRTGDVVAPSVLSQPDGSGLAAGLPGDLSKIREKFKKRAKGFLSQMNVKVPDGIVPDGKDGPALPPTGRFPLLGQINAPSDGSDSGSDVFTGPLGGKFTLPKLPNVGDEVNGANGFPNLGSFGKPMSSGGSDGPEGLFGGKDGQGGVPEQLGQVMKNAMNKVRGVFSPQSVNGKIEVKPAGENTSPNDSKPAEANNDSGTSQVLAAKPFKIIRERINKLKKKFTKTQE
ncbi:uncharacterized protein LOC132197233 [Neocloeon triangulifer]|uniref:uncharacterized protein LOC132197233 n=1 Tax=Neocloeon triangulifer TaxID=2078957 RepID=UPI00286F7C3C|nr:uncharacterized protein LOC132197233 [Neocloeon triangulifer]